jgi:hypothetical protein
MWTALTDPRLIDNIDYLGHDYAPLVRLVEQLSQQPYASKLYAVTSLTHLSLTTAAAYEERDGHDIIHVEYDPTRGLFELAYGEWTSSTNSTLRGTSARLCGEPDEAKIILDSYIVRLLVPYRLDESVGPN